MSSPKPIAFGDRYLSDVTLIVEKQEFLVHKMVLACRSTVFRKLFYFKEVNQGRVEIKDVSVAPFKCLLKILYSEAVGEHLFPFEVNGYYYDPDTDIFQLLEAADRFNLTIMVEQKIKDASRAYRGPWTINGEMVLINEMFDPSTIVRPPRAMTEETEESKELTGETGKGTVFGNLGLSDVTLVVEKHEFRVHKMVLASHSDVFKTMFYGQFKEANQARIELKDLDAATFQRLLEILYYGAVKDRDSLFPGFCSLYHEGFYEFWSSISSIMQLLEVADRFNMSKMVEHELKDAFRQIPCKAQDCPRCTSIYILLLDRYGPFKPNDGAQNRWPGLSLYAHMIADQNGNLIVTHNSKAKYVGDLLRFAKQQRFAW